ncbi:MAG: hypothetical protein KatS3mg130_1981 [Candidatus Sumerlaea sp.]|nr:general secretion pathway protein GspB [Candidatus Sumerlaea chitinivorans]GIX45573.1 MAG: hypothetical protein KatS3mg130_1981 [Candidatus Sumerlaea sp.]
MRYIASMVTGRSDSSLRQRRRGWQVGLCARAYLIVLLFAVVPVCAQTTAPAQQDYTTTEAAREAEKLVARPGEAVQTTDEPELGPGRVVVPTPAVQVSGDKIVVASEGTTEVLDVSSGAELLRRLNIVAPPSAKPKGQRESDETGPTPLFNQAEVRKLLGDNPTVVYQVVYEGKTLPDPMIIPWVRNAIVLKERFDEAVSLLGQNKIQQGRQALLAIITEFPNTDYARQAQELLAKLDQELATPKGKAVTVRATPTPPPVQIMVDPNVRVSSILADSSNPAENRVMINGRSYRAGDTIRGFPNHRVVKIMDQAVIIEVEAGGARREFTLKVRKPESEE